MGGPSRTVRAMDLPRRDPAPHWKQVRPGHFTHHREVWSAAEPDDEAAGCVMEAYGEAG